MVPSYSVIYGFTHDRRSKAGEASVPSGAASPTAMLGARHPTPKTIPWLHGIPGKAAEVDRRAREDTLS